MAFVERSVSISKNGHQHLSGRRERLNRPCTAHIPHDTLTGQLIDTMTGAHLWADRFERDLTDIFALQDEVTVAVVCAIQPKLLRAEITMGTRRRLENLTVYDFYLRTLQHFLLDDTLKSTRTIEVEEFVDRGEIDPRYLIRP